MAEKGWTARIATAAGVAAGTGAAQLGLGYGLGVVVWPVTPASDDSAWLGSLGWATWITASATVFGAVLGSRYRGGPGPRTSGSWRFALAACAAVGSLVTVALIALPARSAVRFDTFTPQVIAGGYAAVGLLLGLIMAFWAVSSRPVAANLMATGVWLWALAIAGIVVELALHRDSATYLTSWQFTEVANSGRYGAIFWPSALLTLGAAVLIGVLAAAPAARRGDFGTGAATSGVAGPMLVAIAFLALAPRLTGTLGPIESAYLIAPYAILAGLAGSAVTIAAGRALAARRPGAVLTSVRLNTMTTSTPPARPVPDIPAAAPALPSAGSPQPPQRAKAAAPAEPPRPSKASAPAEPPRQAKATPPAEPPRQARAAVTAEPPRQARDAVTAEPSESPRPNPAAAEPESVAEPNATKRRLFGRSKVPAQTHAEETTPPRPAPAPVVDAEIAAAARPRRPRPKKDTPAPTPPKSTVTPPPTAPTVAQINPKPSASK
ncbi:Hansenula MRAKII killer toxin-resistant protein 1 [Actinoplanes solisilvae]|uniref:Hansenula MRAKII killer toxin-resistant protein 1 n=1 Tax=Actinoplanes solisilvae TaxID=2486853 RepID=UPI001F0C704E|nr:Hansenula MRAKII killer toxin-resistant protein 1 [Actinoplanes solisilvae]